jgi:hypothetical protein
MRHLQYLKAAKQTALQKGVPIALLAVSETKEVIVMNRMLAMRPSSLPLLSQCAFF